MRVSRIVLLAALLAGFGARAIADIPFLWLDGPKGGAAGRDNKSDPKSPLFVPTNAVPTNTFTPSGPTNTPTNTPIPPTSTPTNTLTNTPIPTNTPTPVTDAKDPADDTAGAGDTALTGAASAGAAQTDPLAHYVGGTTDTADYFQLTVTSGQSYLFTAARSTGTGTLSIELRADPGDTIIGSAVTSAGSPAIQLTAAPATTYYVVVRATGGAIGYTFTYQNNTGLPTNTPTSTNTLTNTPTNTPTYTLTATPTNTPSGGHGAMVMDFENNAANDHTYWDVTAGTMFTALDAFGSTMAQNPWTVSSGTAPGAGNSSSFCGCLSGSLQQDGPPNYPFAQMDMELVAGGSAAGGGGPFVNVTTYSPNTGLQFKYKASVTGIPYRVVLIQSTVTNNAHYEYRFTPSDTNWHTMNVYFPGSGGSPSFSQPYGPYTTWDPTKIGAIEFMPVPVASSTHAYGICIDDVTFAADPLPTPTATYTPGTSTMIADFEDNTANNMTLAPFSGEIGLSVDSFGSTIVESPWGATSGYAPGNGSNYCARIHGLIKIDGPPNFPYAQITMALITGGNDSSGSGPTRDVTTYTPQNELIFDYKAGIANIPYRVAIVMGGVTDYGHYQYIFTPPDTAWHTFKVGFPGYGQAIAGQAGASPANTAPNPGVSNVVFAQPSWDSNLVPWDKTKLGCVQFYPIPNATADENYDLSVDNVRFQ